jgi:hypothetical protein
MKNLSQFCAASILLSSILIAQSGPKFLVQAPGSTGFECCAADFNAVEQLPDSIQSIIRSTLTDCLGDFAKKFEFVWGQSVDLDEFFRLNPNRGTRKWVVPAYELVYTWTDSSLGISRFVLQIHFDKYGQLLEMNFPHLHDQARRKICSLLSAVHIAANYVKRNGYGAANYEIDLKYDQSLDSLVWEVSFVQKLHSQATDYRTVFVDAVNRTVIRSSNTSVVVFH